MWIGGLALETREPAGGATRARDDPDVIRIGECDLRGADGRRTQETSCGAVRGEDCGRDGEETEKWERSAVWTVCFCLQLAGGGGVGGGGGGGIFLGCGLG